MDVSELQSICTDDYIIYILTSVGAQLRGMSVLSFFSLLFLVEVGLGCKYEHSRRHRQRIIQKNIRQGRQLGNLGSTCELRDPRRFLQALVVSEKLQPIKTGQARQGRRQKDKKKRGLRRRKGKDRRRKGSESKMGKGKRQGHEEIWGPKGAEKQESQRMGSEVKRRKKERLQRRTREQQRRKGSESKRRLKKRRENTKKWGPEREKRENMRRKVSVSKKRKGKGQGGNRMGRRGLFPTEPLCIALQEELGMAELQVPEVVADQPQIVHQHDQHVEMVDILAVIAEEDNEDTTTTTTTTTTSTTTTTTIILGTTSSKKAVPSSNGNQNNNRKCTPSGNTKILPVKIESTRNKVDLAIVQSLNSAFTGDGLATSVCAQCSPVDVLSAALCDQCKRMGKGITNREQAILQNRSIAYFSQASYGPTLEDHEICKYPDCSSSSKSVVVGGVSHVVDLPEKLQTWEQAFADSQLSHDVFPGQTGPNREIQYNMQPPRPCSSTTNRVLVNMVPVCQDGDCRSEDPCAGKGKSSFDWSRPLSYGYGSNYFVEDTTGGGFMI